MRQSRLPGPTGEQDRDEAFREVATEAGVLGLNPYGDAIAAGAVIWYYRDDAIRSVTRMRNGYSGGRAVSPQDALDRLKSAPELNVIDCTLFNTLITGPFKDARGFSDGRVWTIARHFSDWRDVASAHSGRFEHLPGFGKKLGRRASTAMSGYPEDLYDEFT